MKGFSFELFPQKHLQQINNQIKQRHCSVRYRNSQSLGKKREVFKTWQLNRRQMLQSCPLSEMSIHLLGIQ